MRILLALLATALPVAAQDPLSAEAFDRMTRGKTFYYAEDGQPYGAEEYRDDREVLWSFLDGECLRGTWYQAGDAICFVYDGLDPHQCWLFYDDGGLRARFLGGGSDLRELMQSDEPLHCPGPDVGV